MKETGILILLFVLSTMQMWGVRAYPHPKTVTQPDGTVLTIMGHGDEFQNYVTTTDGYTVIKDTDGTYRYALLFDGCLVPSKVRATDADNRSASERDFLYGLSRNIRPSVAGTAKKLMGLSSKPDAPLFRSTKKSSALRTPAGISSALDNYRGLVILVNFTDRKFTRGGMSRGLVDDMMNQEDYTYYDDPLLNCRIRCTGSVRDYFYDNSAGLFKPEFDVIGPVEVDVNQYYINGTDRTYELCKKVLESADTDIDYSRYDSDGDGVVDMLYVLYAGYASIYQGNDPRLVWPHAGHFADSEIDLSLDGMRFGRFACSSEIYGWHDDGDMYLDGIGVIVHEFSHVLGFKDHYDVSGYLNEDPGTWDVMASGNYNGIFNDTPCGYNSYEKYAAGFIKPRTLTRKDDQEIITLSSFSSSDDAIRFQSMQDSTVFMLENRQLEKWDKELPGHGMLVWRVDSCDNEYWVHNALNVNGRLHFKLIRALGATRTLFQEIEDKDYDPFPGSRNVYELTNFSRESNLLSDKNYPSPLMLRDIEENDGVISFRVEEDSEALDSPYTFCLKEHYSANGITADDKEDVMAWSVTTGIVQTGGYDRCFIYNLAPDTRNISSSPSGLGAPYVVSGDKKSIIIEPYRVAVTDLYGVWLVDFNDLANGGSGAIVLNMNPYGELTPANPESVFGYCYMGKNNVVVVPEKIVEKFSMVKSVKFDSLGPGNIVSVPDISTLNKNIYTLQGIRITNPKKGNIYIIDGKKVKF